MTFLNAVFLFGFAALAIPPVVHLLNRRRYEVVPWAAVMFLPASPNVSQRLRFQHFPLMLLRMMLIALLAAAFAGPQFRGCQSLSSGSRNARDIVILIDGSASMARGTEGNTPADRVKDYVRNWVDNLGSQQRVSLWVAKQRPQPLAENFSADRELLRNSLELMPQSAGTVDWPAAIQQANSLLQGGSGEREIVVLTDDRRFGWADPESMTRWALVAQGSSPRFPIYVVNFRSATPGEWSNAQLDPIRSDRAIAVAEREIAFRSAVRFAGTKAATTVRILVDGLPVNTLNVSPQESELPVAITFTHRFPAGSHIVTFELPPDGFAEDNRQDYALEVLPSIPVLIVEGGNSGSFLRDALAPPKDTTPAFLVKSIPLGDWQPGTLQQNIRGPNTAPRAVALVNIDHPSAEQTRQLEKYLREGGSIFVAIGERCDAAAWNRLAFRAGEGFLPARIVSTMGELTPESMAGAPRPLPASFMHPAMEIFKEPLPGGLATAFFPKYWKLDANAGTKGSTGTPIASLSNRDPWMVESSFGGGRVILSAHPFDDSWKTNLHRLPDFVRLSHELFYYLTGTRAAQRNLQPGQPLIFRPIGDEPPGDVRLRMPDGRMRSIPAKAWPAVIEGTGEPGAYQLTTSGGRRYWYAVGYDPRESDFMPNSSEDRERVTKIVNPLKYWGETDTIQFNTAERSEPRELWWLLLLIVFGVLLGEVYFTRKLVKSGEHSIPEGASR